ncbi:MAG: hydrogenase iron-sulfur subunit [Burkholderiaceae bacterium]|nr:hydrogenase iron-sulfur subunit [Burkholderiaceae bacterium]
MKSPRRLAAAQPVFVAAAAPGAAVMPDRQQPDPRESRTSAARLVRHIERGFDHAFGEGANPLRQLGGLAFDLFWLVALTGAYLYIFYDTSAEGAYASVERMSSGAVVGGAFVRSLHRYASDAIVVVVVAHVLREWSYGRYRGFRWFTWLTGVPTPWLVLIAGGIGYWLVWDTVALFVATAVAEWFGALPGFDSAMARNFLDAGAVSDRLFSLLIFLHIGVSLALLLAMWLHVKRLTRPATNASRAVLLGSLAALSAASLIASAPLPPPADPTNLGGALALDWFYLAPFAALQSTSPWHVWATMAGLTLAGAAAPWLTRRARSRAPAAVVDPDNCNGCRRCFDDCPYAAIEMAPHPTGRGQIALVDADRCASCGICAGACPSSTPFRSDARLVTGIDLPDLGVGLLRDELQESLEARRGAPTIVVFACQHAAAPGAAPGLMPIGLPCAAMLPPAFVDYALRNGARGVAVVACPPDDCEYRFGAQWISQRLAGEREPRLRGAVDRERVRLVYAAHEDSIPLQAKLAQFRHDLDGLDRAQQAAAGGVGLSRENHDGATIH